MEIQAQITMPSMALLRPGMARRILQQEVGKGVTTLAERIADKARKDVPVDQGILRGSIFTDVSPGVGAVLIRGLVATGRQAPYAEDVERGTKPRWISGDDFEDLKGWAKRKLGDAALAHPVRDIIARRGQRKQPFLMPAARTVEPQVDGVLNAAVASAVQRMQQP